MSDAFINQLPLHVREQVKEIKRRSPQEYERLRKAVRERGPEYIEKEMEKNAEFAELKLALEAQPEKQQQAREAITSAVREQGMEAVIDGSIDAVSTSAIEKGEFSISIESSDESQHVAVSTGTVSETFPLKQSYQDAFLAALQISKKK